MTARTLACLLLLLLFQPTTFAATDRLPADGIASAHPLATRAGQEILDAGGNAFDAAVAIAASLAVVEPMSSGLGGGGLWLLHRARDDFDVMIDSRETAPLAASRNMYLDKEGNVRPGASINGPLSAGIPGIPAALVHLAKKYGRLPLSRTLAPAIRQAKTGFKVNKHYRLLARFRLKQLRDSPAAAAVFLKHNDVPELGDIITQPDLARTLEGIAKQGHKAFYAGKLARLLVRGVRDAGGIWRQKDLDQYRVIERKPIHGQYHDMKIISAAPPSSGGIALVTMLNILSGYDLTKVSPITRKHLIIEAMRRAYRDRAVYLGDPDFVKIPTQRLLSPYYAAGLRASIRTDEATASSSLPGIEKGPKAQDTTHFSVIDRDGNRVSATLTVNYPFGSCYMPPGTGVVLNDEMDDFSAKPGTPNVYGLVGAEANAIAPGKRPLSSMTPTFLENKRGVAVLGTPGGSRIITMVLLATLNYYQGGTPQTMVAVPRFHHQYLPDTVQYEPGALSEKEMSQLSLMGHTFKQVGRAYGNMQVVVWDRQHNKVMAASDPRQSGLAEVK